MVPQPSTQLLLLLLSRDLHSSRRDLQFGVPRPETRFSVQPALTGFEPLTGPTIKQSYPGRLRWSKWKTRPELVHLPTQVTGDKHPDVARREGLTDHWGHARVNVPPTLSINYHMGHPHVIIGCQYFIATSQSQKCTTVTLHADRFCVRPRISGKT